MPGNTPEQLLLDLPVRASLERGDFFVSEANALALAQLDQPEAWPDHRLILVGPEGAGKTHLAHVWAEAQHAEILSEVPKDAMSAVEAPALVLEDVDRGRVSEEGLFHLLNAARASRTPLLMTARAAPKRWPLSLADLKSRIEATSTATIDAPDDVLLSALLVKLFADRQLSVEPRVIAYALARIERSFAAAQTLVEKVDRFSLAEKRAITVRVLGQILET